MRLGDIEAARRKRDVAVAGVLGLDPAETYDIDVRKADHEVWWRHISGDWPQHHSSELASGEHPRLGRAILDPEDWVAITKADDEFAALFSEVPARWVLGMPSWRP